MGLGNRALIRRLFFIVKLGFGQGRRRSWRGWLGIGLLGSIRGVGLIGLGGAGYEVGNRWEGGRGGFLWEMEM